ncbi:Membrane-associated guanylate kinase, WW and PDZ domain-containing protein 3 [Dissostichus eleginoides]|nr:Membrane-associated guanylate kinase, WW and PDZ domain-containing protein 3 [Dissostichus eleginoides]
MSRTLKKKKHWSGKVVECAVSWGNLGDFGTVVEVLGGAELGQFPYLGQMKLDVLVCHVGKLPYYGDVLLEVNGTPVSGLTNRDTLAVIRHFREPIRLKTVKPATDSLSGSTRCPPALHSSQDPLVFRLPCPLVLVRFAPAADIWEELAGKRLY